MRGKRRLGRYGRARQRGWLAGDAGGALGGSKVEPPRTLLGDCAWGLEGRTSRNTTWGVCGNGCCFKFLELLLEFQAEGLDQAEAIVGGFCTGCRDGGARDEREGAGGVFAEVADVGGAIGMVKLGGFEGEEESVEGLEAWGA